MCSLWLCVELTMLFFARSLLFNKTEQFNHDFIISKQQVEAGLELIIHHSSFIIHHSALKNYVRIYLAD